MPRARPGKEAWKRIESAALRAQPTALANEFLGELLDRAKMQMEALSAFRREGAFADARYARVAGLNLAIELAELKTLRELINTPAYRDDASGHDLMQAGSLLHDVWLQIHGAWRGVWERIRLDVILMGLLAAMLWYAVFVRFGDREPWRWLRPVPAMLAGVASVAPTLLLVHYQDHVMGLTEGWRFPSRP